MTISTNPIYAAPSDVVLWIYAQVEKIQEKPDQYKEK